MREPVVEQVVVVVAGDDQNLGVAGGLGQVREERGGELERLAQRPVAQLDDVAEQDHSVGSLGRLEQRRSEALAAQQVVVGARAEVQVGDDQGSHRRPILAAVPG